jgi:hypothetical protein
VTNFEAAGEALIRISELSRTSGRSADTICNWITKGVVIGGHRIKLEGVRVGRSWFTTAQAYGRFLSACNANNAGAVESRELEAVA